MASPTFRFLLLVVVLNFSSVVSGQDGESGTFSIDAKSIGSWLVDSNREEIPESISKLKPLTQKQSDKLSEQLWNAWQTAAKGRATQVLPQPSPADEKPDSQKLDLGQKQMPFNLIERGPTGKKKPLFIALHGGGQDGNAATPHSSRMNSREWNVQSQLAQQIYPDNAIYFVPRMADDRDGRWYYSYCQDAYDRVVREAILVHDVDPNRVYLIGISEGAYTAYRLGAFMADRWAGAGSMAGGEPLANAPPENMRNLAFRADIGERDTMFDRVGLNRRYGEALDELKSEDAEGFEHTIKVHAGRGHGIDYRPCPKWLANYERNPYPNRVRWVNIDVHGRRRMQSYWMALDQLPTDRKQRIEFDARLDRESNSIHVEVKDLGAEEAVANDEIRFKIYLNDQMLNLDKPVHVLRNGKEVFSGKVERRAEVLLRTLAERGDPYYSFPVEIAVGK